MVSPRRGDKLGSDLVKVYARKKRVAPYKFWAKNQDGNEVVPTDLFTELDKRHGVSLCMYHAGSLLWTYMVHIPTERLRSICRRKARLLKERISEYFEYPIHRVDGKALILAHSNSMFWLMQDQIRERHRPLYLRKRTAAEPKARELYHTVLDYFDPQTTRVGLKTTLGSKQAQRLKELRSSERPKINPLQGTVSKMKILQPEDLVMVNECHTTRDFGPVHLGERYVVVKSAVVQDTSHVLVCKEQDHEWCGWLETRRLVLVRTR